jgi:hypothetical protein
MPRTPKPQNPILSAELSRGDAAKLLRTSPGFISKLEKSGALRVNANGNFDLGDFIAQYGDYREARVTSKKLALQEKFLQLKNDKLEREELEWRKAVLPTQYFCDWQTQYTGTLGSHLHSVGSRVGVRDVALRRAIDDEISTAINAHFAEIKKLQDLIKPERKADDNG